jgi:hypothetical protein
VPADNDGPEDFLRLLPPTRSWGEKDLDAHLTSSFAKDTDQPSYELPFLYEKPKDRPADAPPPTDDDDPDDDIVMDFETVLARDLLVEAGADDRPAMIKAARALITKRRARRGGQAGRGAGQARGRLVGAAGHRRAAGQADRHRRPRSARPAGARRQGGDDRDRDQQRRRPGLPRPPADPRRRRHLRRRRAGDRQGRPGPDPHLHDLGRGAQGRDPPGRSADLRPGRGPGRDRAGAAGVGRDRGRAAPDLRLRHQLIDEGNGDGLLQRRERHRMRVSVKNTGDGPATETTAVLRNASGDGVVLDSSRMELGELPRAARRPSSSRSRCSPIWSATPRTSSW